MIVSRYLQSARHRSVEIRGRAVDIPVRAERHCAVYDLRDVRIDLRHEAPVLLRFCASHSVFIRRCLRESIRLLQKHLNTRQGRSPPMRLTIQRVQPNATKGKSFLHVDIESIEKLIFAGIQKFVSSLSDRKGTTTHSPCDLALRIRSDRKHLCNELYLKSNGARIE